MPWARFDDRFPSNRKVRLLSDAAFRLYVSAICWSAENLTDGVVKTTELRLVADVRAARTRAEELVNCGLWEVVSNVGWRIHDYHEYNPTAEQAKADRAAKAARQQRWREKKSQGNPPPEPPDVDASHDPSPDAPRDGSGDAAPRARVPDPTRPDPTPTTGGTGERAGTGGTARGTQPPAPSRPDGRAPLPEDFALTDAMRRMAAATFPTLDVDHETAQFVSHHRADGGRRANWPEEWVKWMRRGAKYASERAQKQQQPVQGAFLVPVPGGRPLTGTDATVQGWLNLRESS